MPVRKKNTLKPSINHEYWYIWEVLKARILKSFAIPFSSGPHSVMASGPITPWEIDGETVETVSDFIFRGSKITADGDYSLKLKDPYSLEGKL